MSKTYAIVDLETTGGMPQRDRIIEVGIVLFDGKEIIDKFQSLVYPGRTISPNITRITGITNEMVAEAPQFYEIAKQVIEITEGAVFVAHNVRFDYHFLKAEFSSLGYTFTRRTLCTVKLSRKAFPNLMSYSLGNLIKYYKIKVEHRHRAFDDAWATTIVLQKIFEEQKSNKELNDLVRHGIVLTKMPTALEPEKIEDLPESCGLYYFMDSAGTIIYIGKSININKRVKQHFAKHTKKTDKLFNQVADISYEVLGSELSALLNESKEIKKWQPSINKIQKTKYYKYAIESAIDKSGYHMYKVVQSEKASVPLSFHGSRKSALNQIEQISELFNLCKKVNKLEKSTTSCFSYNLKICKGACIGEELSIDYNSRFEASKISMNKVFEDNFVVIDKGKSDDDKTIFLVEDGHYRGYGYMMEDDQVQGIEEMKECIQYESINPEADVILRNHIWSNPELDFFYF